MGIKRIISTDFWTDDKVMDIFSPEDKLFFLYLMTNPHTTQLGIYHINKKMMAFEIGYSLESIGILIDRFEEHGLIKYSPETSEVAIKNYLRHSIVKGGKPVEDLLRREIAQVKDKTLLKYVYDNLSQDDNLNATVKSVLPYLVSIMIMTMTMTMTMKNRTTNRQRIVNESYHESSIIKNTRT